MIRPSVDVSLDRAPSNGSGTHILKPPMDLRADGQPALRSVGDRGISTVASKTPMLRWKAAPENGSLEASGFEVEVHDLSGRLVWGSGLVASNATETVVDRELSAHAAYTWRVRVVNGDGQSSPWASSALETGPFDYSDWQARWLSVPHLGRLVTPFRVSSPITRARLYLTGQGVVRAWVNHVVVNPDRMDPTRTDYVRALFRTYDVADSLAVGENTLAFVVGLGEWARTGEPPRLLAELVIWHEDGSVSRVTPAVDSEVTASAVTIDEPFYLERHAVVPASGSSPISAPFAIEPAAWPASPATPPENVSSDPTPPLRVTQTFHPTEIARTRHTRLYDVGENIAGRSTVTVQSGVPAGTLIRVLHGEHVDDAGRIDTTNLTMPYDHGRERQLVEYVTEGVAGESLEPWFAYFGFRYFEVHGLSEDAAVTVTAQAMHTDLAVSGSISTDSPTIDRLLASAKRTLLNNVHGVPEDCPTREQAAWTGDTASVAEYELAAFDSATFIDKWIADLETSQQADGQLPAVAPDLHADRMPSDPVWGSAMHRMLLGHLLHYGDSRLISRALPALRRWADFQLLCIDDDGIISRSPTSYGHDWLALEQTPPPIHHTAAVIDCLEALADLEEAIGDPDAALRRRAVAGALRASARRVFFDPVTGTFGNGSQASYAIAIEAGILTGAEAHAAGERLVALIRERGDRVSSGFATTRSVVRALTVLGRSQVVHDILLQTAEPGVGAMLASGPGTFWECWWIDPANTGTGSLNHVGLGGPFAAWAWEGLAGLRPTAQGYSRFRIAPQFIEGVTRLELRTDTVRGEILIGYSRIGSTARVELTVPVGSEATLEIPGRADQVLAAGSHVVDVDVPEFMLEQVLRVGPSIAPVSGDVFGSRTLLAESIVAPGRGDPLLETLPGLTCMPVPHEQPDHAVLRVIGSTPDATAPTVLITPRTPIAIAGLTFFYALIDQCMEGPEQIASPFLLLHLSDGRTRESSSTGWPAGWNRVAVDTTGLDQDISIVALEVGLVYGDEPTDNALALYPRESGLRAGFHLGEVGFSAKARTW